MLKYIPSKRKILIEKIDKIITTNKKLFQLEFEYKDIIEKFIVCIEKLPIIKIKHLKRRIEGKLNAKITWSDFELSILDNIGENNGEGLIKWINKSKLSFHNYQISNKDIVKNLMIQQLYDNELKTNNNRFIAFGCIIKKVHIINNKIRIKISINHCLLEDSTN